MESAWPRRLMWSAGLATVSLLLIAGNVFLGKPLPWLEEEAAAKVTLTLPAPTDAPDRLPGSSEALTSVVEPPPNALTALRADDALVDATFNVAFRPYGYGPGWPQRRSLVIYIVSSSPAEASGPEFDLAGQNLIADIHDPPFVEIVDGGDYTATLTLMSAGEMLRPVIQEIQLETD